MKQRQIQNPKSHGNIFQPETNLYLIQSQQIQMVLQGKVWRLYDNIYQKYNWKQLFYYMIECSVNRLLLNANYSPKIIQQIQHVDFYELQNLSLYDNKISNVQALSFMNCPHLQVLKLCQNNISSLKSFPKILSRSLSHITANLNPIQDIGVLSRLRLSQTKVKLHFKFGLAYHKLDQSNIQNMDQPKKKYKGYIRSLDQTVKLDGAKYDLSMQDFQSYCQIYLGTAFQLSQPKIQNLLQKKFYQIKFSQFQKF